MAAGGGGGEEGFEDDRVHDVDREISDLRVGLVNARSKEERSVLISRIGRLECVRVEVRGKRLMLRDVRGEEYIPFFNPDEVMWSCSLDDIALHEGCGMARIGINDVPMEVVKVIIGWEGLRELNFGGRKQFIIDVLELLGTIDNTVSSIDLGVGHRDLDAAILEPLSSLISLTHLSLRALGGVGVGGGAGLGDSLPKLKSLTSLSVNVALGTLDVAILRSLSSLTSLTSLSLRVFDGVGDGGGAALGASLVKLRSLNNFKVGIDDLDAAILGSLSSLTCLTSLSLHAYGVGEGGGAALGASLAKLRSLTSLSVSVALDDLDVAILRSLSPLTRLTSLSLSAGRGICDSGGAGLGDSLPKLKSLTSLSVNVGLGVLDAVILGSLSSLTCLTSLSLRAIGGVGDGGGTALRDSFAELKRLTILSLEIGNGVLDTLTLGSLSSLTRLTSLILIVPGGVGDGGGAALGASLSELRSLTSLSLDVEHGGIDAATLRSLSSLTRLTSLSLSAGRGIGDVGGAGLGASLAELKSLTSLNVNVGFGALDAAVLESLSALTCLTSLSLRTRRKFGMVGGAALGASLAELKSLTSLQLPYCSASAILHVARALIPRLPILPFVNFDSKFEHPTHPPREAWRDGSFHSLVRALHLYSQGETILDTSLVFLVGDSLAGKTTLARSMAPNEGLDEIPIDLGTRTIGVEVRAWDPPPLPDTPSTSSTSTPTSSSSSLDAVAERGQLKQVHAMVYDFAGQEVYAAGHALFLNEHALFVLVVDVTMDDTHRNRSIKRWCRAIVARAPHTLIAVMCTKVDRLKVAAAKKRASKVLHCVGHELNIAGGKKCRVLLCGLVGADETVASCSATTLLRGAASGGGGEGDGGDDSLTVAERSTEDVSVRLMAWQLVSWIEGTGELHGRKWSTLELTKDDLELLQKTRRSLSEEEKKRERKVRATTFEPLAHHGIRCGTLRSRTGEKFALEGDRSDELVALVEAGHRPIPKTVGELVKWVRKKQAEGEKHVEESVSGNVWICPVVEASKLLKEEVVRNAIQRGSVPGEAEVDALWKHLVLLESMGLVVLLNPWKSGSAGLVSLDPRLLSDAVREVVSHEIDSGVLVGVMTKNSRAMEVAKRERWEDAPVWAFRNYKEDPSLRLHVKQGVILAERGLIRCSELRKRWREHVLKTSGRDEVLNALEEALLSSHFFARVHERVDGLDDEKQDYFFVPSAMAPWVLTSGAMLEKLRCGQDVEKGDKDEKWEIKLGCDGDRVPLRLESTPTILATMPTDPHVWRIDGEKKTEGTHVYRRIAFTTTGIPSGFRERLLAALVGGDGTWRASKRARSCIEVESVEEEGEYGKETVTAIFREDEVDDRNVEVLDVGARYGRVIGNPVGSWVMGGERKMKRPWKILEKVLKVVEDLLESSPGVTTSVWIGKSFEERGTSKVVMKKLQCVFRAAVGDSLMQFSRSEEHSPLISMRRVRICHRFHPRFLRDRQRLYYGDGHEDKEELIAWLQAHHHLKRELCRSPHPCVECFLPSEVPFCVTDEEIAELSRRAHDHPTAPSDGTPEEEKEEEAEEEEEEEEEKEEDCEESGDAVEADGSISPHTTPTQSKCCAVS